MPKAGGFADSARAPVDDLYSEQQTRAQQAAGSDSLAARWHAADPALLVAAFVAAFVAASAVAGYFSADDFAPSPEMQSAGPGSAPATISRI